MDIVASLPHRQRQRQVLALLVLLALAFLPLSYRYGQSDPVPRPLIPSWGTVPLAFAPNAGQADPGVRFVAHSGASAFAFTTGGVVLTLPAPPALGPLTPEAHTTGPPADLAQEVRLAFLASSPAVAVTGAGLLPGQVNYLRGSDRTQWRTGLPTFDHIRYQSLYPGVDLQYEGTADRLKGTYTVAAGAEATAIRWRYQCGPPDAVCGLTVDDAGALQIHAGAVTLTEQAPVAWQEIGARRVVVAARYHLAADGSIGFALGTYDRTAPLIIDPTLSYATYLGGSRTDQVWSIAVDSAGSAYVTGFTGSEDFPTEGAYGWFRRGTEDAFVTKFSPDGSSVVYSTFLGGDGSDYGTGIAVDSQGQAVVTGPTRSPNFPTANAYQATFGGIDDAFVTKLRADGADLVYSTYLGGAGQENWINLGVQGAVALDAQGNAYVTGNTQSADFPVLNAYQPTMNGGMDAFLTRFSPTGGLLNSTFLGGEAGEGGKSVKVDGQGNVVVDGWTNSQGFPVVNAFQSACATGIGSCHDMFVTKFNAAGSALVYSTYFGGDDYYWIDMATDLALDAAGNAYVTGWTGSSNFPLLNPYQSTLEGAIDAALVQFNPTGTLLYSTYFGGNGTEVGYGVAVGATGQITLAGLTGSSNLPLVDPIQAVRQGGEDGFVTRFSPGGQQIQFSTYFGGSTGREEWGITGIALDAAGDMYIAGHSEAADLPLHNAFQTTNRGFYDGFVAKILNASPTPIVTGTPPSATPTRTPRVGGNYVVTESQGAVIEPGTLDIGNHCNNCVTSIDLPFAVQFYEESYDQVQVSSNGTVGFNFAENASGNTCLPQILTTRVILPHWDDLYTNSAGSGIYTSVSGGAPHRIFNIEWRATIVGGDRVQFEVRLFENSPDFAVIYGPVADSGALATIGVQTDFGGRYTQYTCNTSRVSAGLMLTFTLQGSTITVTPRPTRTATPVRTATATRYASPTNTRPPTLTSTPTPMRTLTPLPGTWEFQAPRPTSHTFNDVFMRSKLEGWAVGDAGSIFHTTDSGRTWQAQASGTAEQLEAVFFYDALHGWATGNTMLYTIDGGQTWHQGTAQVASNYAIEFTDLNNGVAVGIGGIIYRTTDGGRNWTWMMTPTQANLLDVDFGDTLHGWAVGLNGVVLRTTDGGANWALQQNGLASFLRGVSFVSATEGWAVGGDTVLHTTDGGATWQPQPVPGGIWAFHVHFVDRLNGWAAGGSFTVAHTTDGGVTWTVEHQVDPNPFNERDFWGIYAGDDDTAIAVGTGGAIYATEDHGAHWVRRQSGSSAAILDLAATDADHAWAAGDSGDVLYTTDGGQFWHYVNIPVYETYFTFHGIDFADGNNGWVGGEHGVIYHSTDGGRTWLPQSANLSPNQTVWAVEAVDAQTALLAAGGLYRTTDAGQTWLPTQLPPGVGAPFMDVFFVSASTGWAVGADRTIARSTDGGVTWAAQSSGGSELLYRVSFADTNHGWTGGWNGALFHTTNGGATWQPQDADLPDRTSIMGVQAISASVAWISGGGAGPDSRPFVKRTTDGGATWVAESLGTSNRLNTLSAILFTDANTGWAAGSTIPPLGGIFRREPGSGPFPTRTPMASATPTPFGTPTVSPGQTITPGITATPPVPPTVTSCLIEFSDASPGQPFYTFIRCLACHGIVGGYPCGGPGEPCPGSYFRPTNNITRGQVSKIVAESARFNEAVPSSQQTFADVPPSGTFWVWVERLGSRGIIGGYPCGGPFEPCIAPTNRPYFRPNNDVTRGQLSKIIAGAAGWTETPTGQTFADVPLGSTFYVYIERLSSRMVIAGYPCGAAGEPCQPPTNRPYYRPNNPATRGQTSKIAASAFFPNCQLLIRG